MVAGGGQVVAGGVLVAAGDSVTCSCFELSSILIVLV